LILNLKKKTKIIPWSAYRPPLWSDITKARVWLYHQWFT